MRSKIAETLCRIQLTVELEEFWVKGGCDGLIVRVMLFEWIRKLERNTHNLVFYLRRPQDTDAQEHLRLLCAS